MPYTAPPAPAASSSLQIVIDIDSLLVDTAAGVRHALHSVARLRNRRGTIRLTLAQLRSRSLADLIGEIAGCDDAGMIAELVEHYWRVYEQESRFRAPLLPGAASLMRTLAAMNANLHYVSTYGPQAATAGIRPRPWPGCSWTNAGSERHLRHGAPGRARRKDLLHRRKAGVSLPDDPTATPLPVVGSERQTLTEPHR